MLNKIQQLFSPPAFENDAAQTRTARLLYTLLLLQIAVSITVGPLLLFTSPDPASADLLMTSVVVGVVGLSIGLLAALHRGYVRSVGLVVSLMLFAVAFVNVAFFGGIGSNNAVGFALVIAVSGLLLGGNAALAFTGLSVIAGLVLVIVESQGILNVQPTDSGSLVSVWMVFAATVILIGLLLRSATNALDKALALLNERNLELQDAQALLEERVATRTRSLQLVTEISRRLATILDLSQLVSEVVNQVQSTFGYYHAHIYLLNEEEQKLEIAGGTGAAGMAMLSDERSLPLDQGLVGRAATIKEPILIPDVTQDAKWLPDPLLPDTKAETAVPIIYRDTLLGVLDVQHNVVNGLSDEDVRLLQSVAAQVAIALRNARLYAQAQRQAEQQTSINEISRQIQTTTSIEAVMQIATRELTKVLGTQRTKIEIGRGTVEGNGRITG